jgi:hypothetical protein
MTIDRSYVKENEAERRRMEGLIARVDDATLARPLPAGWTVAAALGHLAFWDQRIVLLVDRLRKGAHVPTHEDEVDWINDSVKPVLLAMPPRRLADLALATATAADRAVEALTDAELARNASLGNPINVRRAEHRREHLDEIERELDLAR